MGKGRREKVLDSIGTLQQRRMNFRYKLFVK